MRARANLPGGRVNLLWIVWAAVALATFVRPAAAELEIVEPRTGAEARTMKKVAKKLARALRASKNYQPIVQGLRSMDVLAYLLAVPEAQKKSEGIYADPVGWIVQEVTAGRTIPVHRDLLKVWDEAIVADKKVRDELKVIRTTNLDLRDTTLSDERESFKNGPADLPRILETLRDKIQEKLSLLMRDNEIPLHPWQIQSGSIDRATLTAGPPKVAQESQWKNESPGFFRQFIRSRIFLEQETQRERRSQTEQNQLRDWFRGILADAATELAVIHVKTNLYLNGRANMEHFAKEFRRSFAVDAAKNGLTNSSLTHVGEAITPVGSSKYFWRNWRNHDMSRTYVPKLVEDFSKEIGQIIRDAYRDFDQTGEGSLVKTWGKLDDTSTKLQESLAERRAVGLGYPEIPIQIRGKQLDLNLLNLLLSNEAFVRELSGAFSHKGYTERDARPKMEEYLGKSVHWPYVIKRIQRGAKGLALGSAFIAGLFGAGVILGHGFSAAYDLSQGRYPSILIPELPKFTMPQLPRPPQLPDWITTHLPAADDAPIAMMHDQDPGAALPLEKHSKGSASQTPQKGKFYVEGRDTLDAVPENYFVPMIEDTKEASKDTKPNVTRDTFQSPRGNLIVRTRNPIWFQKAPGTGSGYVAPILHPEGFQLQEVILKDPHSDPSTLSLVKTANGDSLLVSKSKPSGPLEFEAGYSPDSKLPAHPANAPKLNASAVEAEIAALRDTGMKPLADSLSASLERARQENRPMTLVDALLEFQQQGYRRGTGYLSGRWVGRTHYDPYRKFLDRHGILQYTCNNARGIFQAFAKRTLSPEDFKRLRVRQMLRAEVDGEVGAGNGHVRLEWGGDSHTAPLVLDPTPAGEMSGEGPSRTAKIKFQSGTNPEPRRKPVWTPEEARAAERVAEEVHPPFKYTVDLAVERRKRLQEVLEKTDIEPFPELEHTPELEKPAEKTVAQEADKVVSKELARGEKPAEPPPEPPKPPFDPMVEASKVRRIRAIEEKAATLFKVINEVEQEILAQNPSAPARRAKTPQFMEQLRTNSHFPLVLALQTANAASRYLMRGDISRDVIDLLGGAESINVAESAERLSKTLNFLLQKRGELSSAETVHRLPKVYKSLVELLTALRESPNERVHPQYLKETGCGFADLAPPSPAAFRKH